MAIEKCRELGERTITVTYPNGTKDVYRPAHNPVASVYMGSTTYSWKEDTGEIFHLCVLTQNVSSVVLTYRTDDVQPDLLARVEQERQKELKVRRDAEPVAHSVEEPGGGSMTERDVRSLPATRKQLTYLESLIKDTVEDGMPKFEEMIGKHFSRLTREEASEWIGRLSGSAA